MKNPYNILDLPLDATPSQIVRAQMTALRKRKYSNREITEAQAILRKPASRLAADFTFPILDSLSVPPLISQTQVNHIDITSIDINKYNSLK